MAAGRRVLVSGMGGDLGSRVAVALEDEPWVGELVGIDVDPPRRRLHRADFHLIAPVEHDRIVETITAFNPHVVVHISVWEPHSRANPATARELTDDSATSILGAAAECRALESLIVRSGIEIYGRAHGAPTRPDESADVDPTCEYGEMLAGIEHTANAIGARIGVSVGAIRMASVLGPHVPSPLGRVLRMPAVPFSVLADPPFAVVEDAVVARAFVAAAERRLAEPVNVVANGAITALQAARRGRRIPLPLDRSRLGARPHDQRPARRADPRPRPGDLPPRSSRRQRADGGAARLHVVDDHRRGDRPPLRVADRRAHPGPEGGRVTDTTYESRVITLPVERTLTAARRTRGVGDGPPGRRRRVVDRRRLGARRRPRRTASVELAALRWNTVIGGIDRLPVAGRRADRRQHPPVVAGPRSRPPSPSPGRPVAPPASSAGPTSRRSAPSPGASVDCSPGPTRSLARCAPASCS